MIETETRSLCIALNAAPKLARPAAYRLALEPERWAGSAAPPARLAAALGVPVAQMERALAVARDAGALAARELAAADRLGARLLLRGAPGYPEAFGRLDLPPPVLYLRGRLPAEEAPAVAIVGSRRADAYGREVAELFARALAEAGVAVVSGFAQGVDAAAHRGALAAAEEGAVGMVGTAGTTVAVLGCGLGVDYPRGHASLGEEIAGRGALLTEFPCGMAPLSWHFPLRNRLIAALADGTLVVQAAARSGSLITARHALDLGREVWAVPGRIFEERSAGPNTLIRDGAALVQHPREILEMLRPARARQTIAHQTRLFPPRPERFSPPAEAPLEPELEGLAGDLLAALPAGALRLPEELAAAAGAPVDAVLGALLELELLGRVRRHPGGSYGR